MDLFNVKMTESILAYYGTGTWGNYLVIEPRLKLVAVRLVKMDTAYIGNADLFERFVSKIFNLESRASKGLMWQAVRIKDLSGQLVWIVHNVLPWENERVGPNFKLIAGATFQPASN